MFRSLLLIKKKSKGPRDERSEDGTDLKQVPGMLGWDRVCSGGVQMLCFTAASQDFHFFPRVLCTGWVGFARYIRLMQCILEQVLFNQYYLVILFCSAWWQVWASGVVGLHRYYLVTVPHGLAKSEGRNITDSSTTALQMKRLCNLSSLMHLWVSVS